MDDSGKRDDAELLKTLMLAERLLAPLATADVSTRPAPPEMPSAAGNLVKSVHHWVWRAGRRTFRSTETQALAEHYEREIERQATVHAEEADRVLTRERGRVVELEGLIEQLRHARRREVETLRTQVAELQRQIEESTRAHAAEMARRRDETAEENEAALRDFHGGMEKAQARIAELEEEKAGTQRHHADALSQLRAEATARAEEALRRHQDEMDRAQARIAQLEKTAATLPAAMKSAASATADLAAALSRAEKAEERARMAENKAKILKETMGITPDRASRRKEAPPDERDRFREAKRAFALHFHPDQGGRENPEREKLFQAFWPVLERIERGK